eukprot:8752495-Karenia_brevis.AAC.1
MSANALKVIEVKLDCIIGLLSKGFLDLSYLLKTDAIQIALNLADQDALNFKRALDIVKLDNLA